MIASGFASARSRNLPSTGPREIATTRPLRSITNVSGSALVPYFVGELALDVAHRRVREAVVSRMKLERFRSRRW